MYYVVSSVPDPGEGVVTQTQVSSLMKHGFFSYFVSHKRLVLHTLSRGPRGPTHGLGRLPTMVCMRDPFFCAGRGPCSARCCLDCWGEEHLCACRLQARWLQLQRAVVGKYMEVGTSLQSLVIITRRTTEPFGCKHDAD